MAKPILKMMPLKIILCFSQSIDTLKDWQYCAYFSTEIQRIVWWKYQHPLPHPTSDNSVAPSLNYIVVIPIIKFDDQGLEQDKVTFTHGKVVNIYISSEICDHTRKELLSWLKTLVLISTNILDMVLGLMRVEVFPTRW